MNTQILDLIAGMIFIYFLLALVNNSFVEVLFSFFKTRAYNLKNWIIRTFLKDAEFNKLTNYFTTENNFDLPNKLLNHPLLTGTSKENKSSSYMNSKSFAVALLEIIKLGAPLVSEQSSPLQNLKNAVFNNNTLPIHIKELLLTFIERSQIEKNINQTLNEIKHVEDQIENWFNSSMERLGGKLKRWSMLITFIFGVIITCSLNIDSIAIAKYLYNNPEANAKLAAAAYQEASDSTYYKKYTNLRAKLNDSLRNDLDSMLTDTKTTKAYMNTAINTLALSIPIGWTDIDSKKWLTDSRFTISKIGGFFNDCFCHAARRTFLV